ncbi:signal peptidase I [Lachnospiraceae bacterium ZAX-1]
MLGDKKIKLDSEYDDWNTLNTADKKTSVLRELLGFLAYILIIFILSYLVLHFVGQRTKVEGSSMETALSNGDHLITDKISYRFKSPERFDIIIFPFQYAEKTYYIKRVIGLPGESVHIDDAGTIFIDGKELVESYGREVMENPGIAAEEFTLAEDEYFVLGDNRNASSDSRDQSVANIKRKDIVGRAWLRIYPFNKMGFLKDHEGEKN